MFVVIGSVTADLLVIGNTLPTNLGGDGFRDSNLVFTDSPLTISMGGNGGNSAYVLAGLGAPTALCGAVGQDLLGDTLVRWLETRNVNLSGLVRSAAQATSTSTIVMTDAANQAVFHHLGSTAHAQFEDMPDQLFATAGALLVSSFPIMRKMRAGGFARALAAVHQNGGITALDIGPAIAEPVTLAELAPLLPTVDYLTANAHELTSLTGTADWPDAAEAALNAGAKNIIVKQGERGATAVTAVSQINVPGFKVEVNVAVGAGDAFNVGLLYALREGRPLEQALRFGNAVGALVVSSPRGVLSSPSLNQVEAFLDTYP